MGIIGCSTILPRAIIGPAKAIDNLCIYGIASRKRSKADEYAKKYKIDRVFDSYEDLLNCEDIHCVYIALPNDLHIEWVLKAINANKHVLVEKPMCLKSDEFDLILKEYEKKNIKILEGLAIQHHPWQLAIKDMVSSAEYGKLQEVKTDICIILKNSNENNYRRFPERGGGAFYDLGCYWLQFLQFITGAKPESYKGSSKFDGPNNCDWTFNANAEYKSGLKSSFIASFELPYKVEHILKFEKATVKVHDFFRACLGNYKIKFSIEVKEDGSIKKYSFDPQNYYVNQLRFFMEAINGSKEDIYNMYLRQSYERVNIMEEIYEHARYS
ncbi:Gfo/Idh/MocA family protein [Clostridium acetobutylicum]|nr:Gfo/Idh/MocA family oxidoreductase [Clostridium acetobutylicum]NYC96117.1 putative dehydrogenase [Clostridium acetobutylicum]OOL94738.1 1,5-anhydro-D-fructose reductase [Clostridium acetobutylicum]OOM05145.1 1,5-anhydro-D-fructose reductase [Clostridium acetobutylicum]